MFMHFQGLRRTGNAALRALTALLVFACGLDDTHIRKCLCGDAAEMSRTLAIEKAGAGWRINDFNLTCNGHRVQVKEGHMSTTKPQGAEKSLDHKPSIDGHR